MRVVLFAVLIAATAARVAAQPGTADLEKDKAAIVQTALDYAEGYYGGEPARMTRALSPYLTKRGLMAPPNAASILVEMNADTLIEFSNGAKLPPAERRITTEVLHVNGDIASARVFTAQFNDYLHLIKRGGAWQILNVLWHRPPGPPDVAREGADAVKLALQDYAAALFAGDSQQVRALLHPLAHLRVLAAPNPQRSRIVTEQNAETLAAAIASGQAKFGGTVESAQIAVDGVDTDIAAGRLMLGPVAAYVHLARQDGKWRIVNALMYPPAAPAKS